MALGTMAQWAWHSFPNTGDYKLADVKQAYDSHGRDVFYPVGLPELRQPGEFLPERTTAAAKWLIENSHRIHLARIGLVLPQQTNPVLPIDAVSAIGQRLDLWTGCVESRFQLLNSSVRVETALPSPAGCNRSPNHLPAACRQPTRATRSISLRLRFLGSRLGLAG
jgi:hypothetical protein